MRGVNQSEKQIIAGLYNRAAATYGQVGIPFFAALGERLVELTQAPAGTRVLDVATGRGAVLLPAIQRVGPEGMVIGIDIAEQMVTETDGELRRRRIQNAHVLQMDAGQLAFVADTFESVLCAFAIFFFSQLDVALSGFFRVLRKGGRLGLSMTARGDERWQWYNDLLVEFDREHHILVNLGSRVDREPDQLRQAMQAAGFITILTVNEETEFFYPDEEAWWAFQWSHGARQPLEQMNPAVLDEFKVQALARVKAMKRPEGIPQRYAMMYMFGVKPK